MFAELAKVMDHAIEDDNYLGSLSQNIINKKTNSGIKETTQRLRKLYSFDLNYNPFKALKYFWQISDEKDKPILALIYAIGHDFLLAESILVVVEMKLGEKVTIEKIDENIVSYYPNRYSENTRRSISQNIASSWKQAGFITGKVKNIRTQPDISYIVVTFAFFMAYLDGLRGDFILTSKWVKALSLSDSIVRELAIEAAKRDFMQYQFAGSVTAISFNSLTNKLEINGI
jgi:hypothetical protein